jgi:hypothetical protein
MADSAFNLEAEDAAALRRVQDAYHEALPGHDEFVINGERRYARYRSYQALRNSWQAASPKDKDLVLRTGRREFGAPMVVPIAFRAVETTVPRVLAADPRLNVRPGHPDFEGMELDVKVTLERQGRQAKLRLGLQDVCKSGAIYGIGGGKCFWKQEYREKRSLVQLESGAWASKDGEGKPNVQRKLVYDDPAFEAIDMFDAFWDPYAYDTDHLRYFIHRTWRDELYVRQMVERGVWRAKENDPTCPWTLEDMCKGSSNSEHDQAFEQRQRSSGVVAAGRQAQSRSKMHSVWEFHDGDRVITVLDGTIPVQRGENPYWHRRIPFHFWRPRRVPHEFVGIGIIEPIEMLHDELMELRGNRADNSMLALQRVFAYYDGLVDPESLKFGPGLAIPVNGDPRELLYPIEIPDVPNSGYQEEDRLLAELERASGLSDQDQASMMAGTATGAQLVSAQVNLQTQLMAQLLEVDLVGPLAEQFFELNQQKITKERTFAGPPKPEDGPDRRWSWYKIGPAVLKGQFEIEPVGQSTMPSDGPASAQKAIQMLTVLGDRPEIKQEKLIEHSLTLLGVENAATWIAPPPPQEQQLDPKILDRLERMGVPADLIDTAVHQHEFEQQQAQATGPGEQGPDPAMPANPDAPPAPSSDAQAMAGVGSAGGQP